MNGTAHESSKSISLYKAILILSGFNDKSHNICDITLVTLFQIGSSHIAFGRIPDPETVRL